MGWHGRGWREGWGEREGEGRRGRDEEKGGKEGGGFVVKGKRWVGWGLWVRKEGGRAKRVGKVREKMFG